MPSGDPERKRLTIPKPKTLSVQERKRLSMKDVLLWAAGEPPKPGPRRIGIHTSTAGGVEMAAFALRWILMNEAVSVVIPGAKTPDQARGNAGAAELPPIPPTVMAAMQVIYEERIAPYVHQRW